MQSLSSVLSAPLSTLHSARCLFLFLWICGFITLTLLGMFWYSTIEKSVKKGKQLHEKVSKKIIIKKEDINKENNNFQIQESGNLLKGVNYQLFQKQNKQQPKLKVKESDIFGQLRVQVMANMELFPKWCFIWYIYVILDHNPSSQQTQMTYFLLTLICFMLPKPSDFDIINIFLPDFYLLFSKAHDKSDL